MVGDSLGQASGTSTTNTKGRFSFTGLPRSEYVVEVLAGDESWPAHPQARFTCAMYRLRVLGQWFDGIRFYAAASSPRRSRRT